MSFSTRGCPSSALSGTRPSSPCWWPWGPPSWPGTARAISSRGFPGRLLGAAAILLGALVVVTAVPWQGIKLVRFPEHPAVNGLRHHPQKVLYLPLWPGDNVRSSPSLLYLTRTRVPALNGYSPLTPRVYVTEVFEPLQGLNLGELGPAGTRRSVASR